MSKQKIHITNTICICLLLIITMVGSFMLAKYALKTEPTVLIERGSNTLTVTYKVDLKKADYVSKVIHNVDVTSYNNEVGQTDDTPNITASNRPVKEGMVAVSRDFIKEGLVKYGDFVYIDCFDKWYVIDDTMNERFTKRIDVFLYSKSESLKINKKCNIELIHVTK